MSPYSIWVHAFGRNYTRQEAGCAALHPEHAGICRQEHTTTMKANTIIAIAVSIGVLLVAFVQAAILFAGAISPSHMPSLGPTAGVWDQFLATPIVFMVVGLIYGLIAGVRTTIKQTLTVAAISGIAVAVALVAGTHSLVSYLQQVQWRAGQQLPFSIGDSPQSGWVVAAMLLWVGWYVMGAAIGYQIRNRRKPATS